MSLNKLGFVVAGLSAFAFGSLTQAAPINYGNFIGPNVTYTNVQEVDSQIPGPTPPSLFGMPALSGDSLLFDPINFTITVTGGASELQDGRLAMGISAGHGLSSFSISEGGGYAVDDGTSNTFVSDTLVINNLFITSINGIGVNPIVVTPTITFTHTGLATAVTTSDSITLTSSGGLDNGGWTGVASFNLAAALAADGLQGTVTGLSLDLNNQLAAQTEGDSSAFIDKKNFLLGPGTIPEPASIGLIGLGLAVISRRRKA